MGQSQVWSTMEPPWIRFVPEHPTDTRSDLSPENLEAKLTPRALRHVPPAIPEQFVQFGMAVHPVVKIYNQSSSFLPVWRIMFGGQMDPHSLIQPYWTVPHTCGRVNQAGCRVSIAVLRLWVAQVPFHGREACWLRILAII